MPTQIYRLTAVTCTPGQGDLFRSPPPVAAAQDLRVLLGKCENAFRFLV
ncbi:hypothetical protein E2C01_099082 [Portunus trituberculatus]|uniref:Uncharacterized protein n=1 Tax=Portunus trituberculatus TaxID=210409 RepID=A0A5B7K4I5_PORTR|nr:hypothetical protein [Portunus trituberculatus]